MEVVEAIKKMRNRKSSDEDSITAELIKHGGAELWKAIHKIVCTIWKEERMPTEWKVGIIYKIYKIYKKEDKRDCNNYCGITLLNAAYKIL